MRRSGLGIGLGIGLGAARALGGEPPPPSVAPVRNVVSFDATPSGIAIRFDKPTGYDPTAYVYRWRTPGHASNAWQTFEQLASTSGNSVGVPWEWISGLPLPETTYDIEITSVIAGVTPTPVIVSASTAGALPARAASYYQPTADKVLAAYDARPTYSVASSPPTITAYQGNDNIRGASSSVLTAQTGTVDTTAIPTVAAHPIGKPHTGIYGNRLTHARRIVGNSVARFRFRGRRFNFQYTTNSVHFAAGVTPLAAPLRIAHSVDGTQNMQWLSAGAPALLVNTGGWWVEVDYGAALSPGDPDRIIEVHVPSFAAIHRWCFDGLAPGAAPDPAPPANAFSMMVYLDSVQFGQGCEVFTNSLPMALARKLGAPHAYNMGYQANPWGTRGNGVYTAPVSPERMSNPSFSELTSYGDQDVLVLYGSINDDVTGGDALRLTQLRQRVRVALELARQRHPEALIEFVLQYPVAGTVTGKTDVHQAYIDAFNDALGSDPGARLFDTIGTSAATVISNDPAAGTIFPGWAPTSTTPLGNGLHAVNGSYTDVSHPRDEGHDFVSTKVAEDIVTFARIRGTYPPVNTVAPTFSGVLEEGETLTGNDGAWVSGAGAITGYARQWQAGGADIPGATAQTLTLAGAQVGANIRYGSAGINAAGTAAMVYSAAQGPVIASGAYDSDAAALFAAWTADPGTTQKDLWDDFIRGMKAAGLWTKTDSIAYLAGHDAQSSLLDAKRLVAMTPLGSPTHTPGRGYTFGSSAWIDTAFDPATAAGRVMSQNSAAFFSYINQSSGATNVVATLGTLTGNQHLFIRPRQAGGVFDARVFSHLATSTFGTPASRLGSRLASRTGASTVKGYVAGVQSGSTSTVASLAPVSANVIIGRQAGTSNTFDRIAFEWYGAGLDDAEAATLDSLITTLLTGIGAN